MTNDYQNTDKRIRVTMHNGWKGHPFLSDTRKIINKLKPDELLSKLLDDGSNQSDFKNYCSENGIDLNTVKQYWDKSERFSVNVSNPVLTREQMLEEFLEIIDNKAPAKFKTPKVEKQKRSAGGSVLGDPHLMLLGLTDLHVDKFPLVDMYQKVHEAVKGILEYTAGFNIEKVVIIIGSDMLNSEGATGKTLKGTPVQNALAWHQAFPLAVRIYQNVIDMLLPKFPVDGVCLVGNHDTSSSIYLGHCIAAHYKRSSHVNIDTEYKYRKAFKYGTNLIGLAHGHGPRKQKFTQLLASEYAHLWGETTHRYMNIGHFHADYSEKMVGCNLRILPSPSSTDDWHDMKGYTSETESIQALLYNKNKGGEVVIPYSF